MCECRGALTRSLYRIRVQRIVYGINYTDVSVDTIKNFAWAIYTFTDHVLLSLQPIGLIFTAQCYASAVHAVIMCPSVDLSVSLSFTSPHCTKTAEHRITQKRHTIAHRHQFPDAKYGG